MNPDQSGSRPCHRDLTWEETITPLEQRALGLFVGDEQRPSTTARSYLRVSEGGRTRRVGMKVNGLALTEKDEDVWQTLRQLYATSRVPITPTSLGMKMRQPQHVASVYVSGPLRKLVQAGLVTRMEGGTYVPNDRCAINVDRNRKM